MLSESHETIVSSTFHYGARRDSAKFDAQSPQVTLQPPVYYNKRLTKTLRAPIWCLMAAVKEDPHKHAREDVHIANLQSAFCRITTRREQYFA